MDETYSGPALCPHANRVVYNLLDFVFNPIAVACKTHWFKQTVSKPGCSVTQSCPWFASSIFFLHLLTSMQHQHSLGLTTPSREQFEQQNLKFIVILKT